MRMAWLWYGGRASSPRTPPSSPRGAPEAKREVGGSMSCVPRASACALRLCTRSLSSTAPASLPTISAARYGTPEGRRDVGRGGSSVSCTSRAAAAARAVRTHTSTRYILSTAFPDGQPLPAMTSYLKDLRSGNEIFLVGTAHGARFSAVGAPGAWRARCIIQRVCALVSQVRFERHPTTWRATFCQALQWYSAQADIARDVIRRVLSPRFSRSTASYDEAGEVCPVRPCRTDQVRNVIRSVQPDTVMVVGPASHCSPRHRMPSRSRNECSNCV